MERCDWRPVDTEGREALLFLAGGLRVGGWYLDCPHLYCPCPSFCISKLEDAYRNPTNQVYFRSWALTCALPPEQIWRPGHLKKHPH